MAEKFGSSDNSDVFRKVEFGPTGEAGFLRSIDPHINSVDGKMPQSERRNCYKES